MPKITFMPMNKTVDAEPGQTVLDVAMDNDVEIPHACGGNCACGACVVAVREGELSPKDEDTEGMFTSGDDRLACVARIMNSDVTVEVL